MRFYNLHDIAQHIQKKEKNELENNLNVLTIDVRGKSRK